VASLWVLMRAFASGCTAMTGVEAVSNGASAFREPAVRHAQRTLTAIIGTLHIAGDEQAMVALEEGWERLVRAPASAAGLPAPKLIVVYSPFRQMYNPLTEVVSDLKKSHPDREIAVITPELPPGRGGSDGSLLAFARERRAQVSWARVLPRYSPHNEPVRRRVPARTPRFNPRGCVIVGLTRFIPWVSAERVAGDGWPWQSPYSLEHSYVCHALISGRTWRRVIMACWPSSYRWTARPRS
jgi:hypothetical protein